MDGQSRAAAIPGGAVALLIPAAPELPVAVLEGLLRRPARDLPPAGVDPASGSGLIDLPAALAAIRKRRLLSR